MIQKFEIQGIHMEVGDDLRRYITKKIGHLDRFTPHHARASLHAEIKLKEGKSKSGDERTCEVIIRLPHETLMVKETTINIYAAIDIAEAKLKLQIKKYKDQHASPRLHRRLLARFNIAG